MSGGIQNYPKASQLAKKKATFLLCLCTASIVLSSSPSLKTAALGDISKMYMVEFLFAMMTIFN